jgi:hypothetical protein
MLVGVSDFFHIPYMIICTCTILTLYPCIYCYSLSNLFQMEPRINTEACKVTSNNLTIKVHMPTKRTAKALILPLLNSSPILNNTGCLNNNIMEDNPCISSNNPIRLSLRMVVSPCPQRRLLGEQPPAQMGKFTTTTPLLTKLAGTNPLACLELPRAVVRIDEKCVNGHQSLLNCVKFSWLS